MKSEVEIYEAVARGWCHKHNSSKEMDSMLATAIAIEVLAVVGPLIAERDTLAAKSSVLDTAWTTLADDAEWECDCKVCAAIRALTEANLEDRVHIDLPGARAVRAFRVGGKT